MDNKLIEKIKSIQSNIRQLKTTQTIGGDSWVVYRTMIPMPTPTTGAGSAVDPVYRIDFTPEVEGPFVAKAFSSDSDRPMVPDPNYYGRWYLVEANYAGNWQLMIYSTKKGTATVTQISA